MSSAIGLAIAALGCDGQRPSPSDVGILKVPDRRAVLLAEKLLMTDLARQLQPRPHGKLALEHLEGARAKLDEPVRTRLRTVFVEFKYGGKYNYFDVPKSVFEQMKAAVSKGQFSGT